MPRPSRTPLLLLLLAVLLPVFFAACAAGNTASDPAPVEPTPTSAPTPTPTTTTTTPPPKKDPDEALAPEVVSVTPNKAAVGSVGPSIVVGGNNFVPRSIVQLDGQPLATSFVSGTELRATIPSTKLTAVATLNLSVGTSPPGGGASKVVTFQVENAAATLTSISPLSVLAGAPATKLTLTGTGFANGAIASFGATTLPTTFVDDKTLETNIPANLLVTSQSVPVKVTNPAPGGGDSTTIAFTVANPNASIQSINPSSATVGQSGFTMTVNGAGFVAASVVKVNGTNLATTFVNGTQLTATVPAASLLTAGDLPVAVSNPPPGGGVTAPVILRVQYPTPSLTSLSPSSSGAGAAPTEVTVTGTGFFNTSQVTFDNAPAFTTYVDATHVKATLAAAQLATGGTISVRVVNPAPGGGSSQALSFTVNNPSPTITTLAPSSVAAGAGDTTITITGTNFVAASMVKSQGVLVATTYVSATSLTAVVPSTQLVSPGNVGITVTNPTPGGGTSAAKNLVVTCDTTGVDVALGALNTTTTLPTNFAAAPLQSIFVDGSGSCATTQIDPNFKQPSRYWVVQNTAGASVTLSAWAVCPADGKQYDAFLTFYKRPTVPASDLERLVCTPEISEGINGAAGKSSPEPGNSGYCPGLTKANGGGLVLAACEKAVVHIQAYDAASATYPPPASIKVKPE